MTMMHLDRSDHLKTLQIPVSNPAQLQALCLIQIKRVELRPTQLLQGCPSSLFLGPSMIQRHPIEWILQLLILFVAMHSQSARLEMSPTCCRHVADKAKCGLFLPRRANFGDIKFCVSAHFCVVMFRHWSDPKIKFVFVLHKCKYVICVCYTQTCIPKILFCASQT